MKNPFLRITSRYPNSDSKKKKADNTLNKLQKGNDKVATCNVRQQME